MRFSSVTSIHRVSGRAMREALMVGDRAQKGAGSTGRPSAWSVKSTPIPAMTSCARLRPTPTLPKLLDLAGELPMDCQTGRKRRGRAEAPSTTTAGCDGVRPGCVIWGPRRARLGAC
jgi:hypothetical protein